MVRALLPAVQPSLKTKQDNQPAPRFKYKLKKATKVIITTDIWVLFCIIEL